MKTLLLTGTTGFFGSQLLKHLIYKYQLVVLKRSYSDTHRIQPYLQQVKCYDVDKTELSDIFNENRIDAVVHMATFYGHQSEEWNLVFETNVSFTLQLAKEAICHQVPLFINTDTFSSRDNKEYSHLKAYNLSKRQAAEWLQLVSENVRVVNMRLFHLYGKNDLAQKFVPMIIRRIKDNEAEIDLTKGEQKRDFIFADDAVNSYTIVLKNFDRLTENFVDIDVGTGITYSIRKFVETAHRVFNSNSKLNFGAIPYRAGEFSETVADTTILNSLGWTPKTSLEEGIRKL